MADVPVQGNSNARALYIIFSIIGGMLGLWLICSLLSRWAWESDMKNRRRAYQLAVQRGKIQPPENGKWHGQA
jgi:hypothetical protein